MTDQYPVLYSSYRWLVPNQFNIAQVCLQRWSANTMEGRRPAMQHEDAQGLRSLWSYSRLADTSNRLANGLRKMGIRKGDRVVFIMSQRPEAAAAALAVFASGAILVPLSPLLGIDGLNLRLRDAEASLVIADASAAPDLTAVMAQNPAIRQLIGLDFQNDYTLSWRTLLARESGSFQPVATVAEDPAILLYTAGTTGMPKGVLHAHRALIGILPAFVAGQNWFPQDGDLFWSPADWAAAPGLLHGLLAVLYFGRTLVTSEIPLQGKDALALLGRYPITNTLLLPNDLALMREAAMQGAGVPGHALRAVMVTGESLPAPLRDWVVQALGTEPNEIYGLTEAPGLLGHSHEKWPSRPGSLGRPIPGHRIGLLDAQGESCSSGSAGQLALHRRDIHGHPDPCLFLSYWNNDALTQARFKGDWFLTGDMAALDSENYYWFSGRCDDVFRAGTHRISPLEIEECLQQHPAVHSAAVVPKPAGERGYVIKAFVVPYSPGDPDLPRALQVFIRERLASWQVPEEIELIERLPLTPQGQVRRHVLRAREQQRSMLAAARAGSGHG